MDAPVGVGLISFAHGHQHAWADVFAQRSDTRVAAVWDDDEARGKAQAEKYGVPYVTDLAELLGRDDVQAVTICSENAQHAAHAVAAAEAGKHVMVQKPMAVSLEHARAIEDAVAKSGITYMQAYTLRFDPLHLAVKELVDSGAVGRVMTVRRRHSHHFGLSPDDVKGILQWMADKDRSGGGALMDEGAHALLWYIWMFGMPTAVSATMSTSMPHLSVDDNAVLTMTFEDGVIGTLQTSWTEIAAGPTIEIYGDEGALIATGTDIASSRFLPEPNRWLQLFRQSTGEWEYPDVAPEMARPVPAAHAFIDCLLQGEPSPVPADVARGAIEIAMAAYESDATGRRVSLPLP